MVVASILDLSFLQLVHIGILFWCVSGLGRLTSILASVAEGVFGIAEA